jgi:hypothetical protein
MFIFGHVITAADSHIFGRGDLLAGEGVLGLMFPDLVSCHEWGYRASWDLDPSSPTATLIKAHMIGDAVVHYGARWAEPNRRRGWAYRRMGIVSRAYNAFFARARAEGLLICPDGYRPDSVRGWAHTIIEYTVDQFLTDTRRLDESFQSIRAEFTRISGRIDWIEETLAQLGIAAGKPFPAQPLRYARCLADATEPDEFHLRGLIVKFGLVESAEVIGWLRGMLRSVIGTIGREEMEDVVGLLGDVVRDPIEFSYPIAPWERPWFAPPAGFARGPSPAALRAAAVEAPRRWPAPARGGM